MSETHGLLITVDQWRKLVQGVNDAIETAEENGSSADPEVYIIGNLAGVQSAQVLYNRRIAEDIQL